MATTFQFGDERLPGRFWSNVQVSIDGCWLWTGALNSNGYGVGGLGRRQGAHRVAFESANGPVERGLVLDHLCRVRHCVNPSHLEAVTQQENLRRGNGRGGVGYAPPTHCHLGHDMTVTGAYLNVSKSGYVQRSCKQCAADHQRAYRARKRAARAMAA